jgi:hypothetical protein
MPFPQSSALFKKWITELIQHGEHAERVGQKTIKKQEWVTVVHMVLHEADSGQRSKKTWEGLTFEE